MKRSHYRQGDILFVAIPTEDVPAAAAKVRREKGRIVVAHGEVTGHAHTMTGKQVELRAVTPEGGFVSVDDAAELYLLVHGTEQGELTHDEHATILLDPGAYKIVRQREYSPEKIRRVAD